MNINYSNIILLYNLAIIILICIIFIIVIKRYLSNTYDKIENFNMKDSTINYNNNFKYIPSNARIMYENSGIYPWNRHIINSSIPYDVNVKKEAVNVYYYEFDNNTYNEKLKDVFKNNCKDLIIAIEGNKWSKWKNPKSEKDKDIQKQKFKEIYNRIENEKNWSQEKKDYYHNKMINGITDLQILTANCNGFTKQLSMVLPAEKKV